jgi:hypothetical protein
MFVSRSHITSLAPGTVHPEALAKNTQNKQ